MSMRWRVLTICSEGNRQAVQTAMSNWSLEVQSCSTVQEARTALRGGRHPVILCEDRLPDGSYEDILKLLGGKLERTRVVVMAATDLDECYRQAHALGAFDVIASPCQRTDVQWIVIRAVQDHQHRSSFRPGASPEEPANATSSPIAS